MILLIILDNYSELSRAITFIFMSCSMIVRVYIAKNFCKVILTEAKTSIVKPARRHLQRLLVARSRYSIHQPVFLRDAARPEA